MSRAEVLCVSIVSDEQCVMVETCGAPGLVSRPQHPHQTRQRVSETKQRPLRELFANYSPPFRH